MYTPSPTRYDDMPYHRCGKSGLKLSAISLGLWHNFGDVDNRDQARQMITTAFDRGITHFDLANNYGTPRGSAERNFGEILRTELSAHRHELTITTKAGYDMWEGPYGIGGSRKYLFESLNQSLQRLGTDHVDIFYSHRYDSETPLEETMTALADTVRSGKALYVGISNYPPDKAQRAYALLRNMDAPCVSYQGRYSIFARSHEFDTMPMCDENGVGFVAFSPLAEGLLSNRYLNGIPDNSRAAQSYGHLNSSQITPDKLERIVKLNDIAQQRGQSLSQMALAWALRESTVATVIIGTSSTGQLLDNLKATENTEFSPEELWLIGELGGDYGNLAVELKR